MTIIHSWLFMKTCNVGTPTSPKKLSLEAALEWKPYCEASTAAISAEKQGHSPPSSVTAQSLNPCLHC